MDPLVKIWVALNWTNSLTEARGGVMCESLLLPECQTFTIFTTKGKLPLLKDVNNKNLLWYVSLLTHSCRRKIFWMPFLDKHPFTPHIFCGRISVKIPMTADISRKLLTITPMNLGLIFPASLNPTGKIPIPLKIPWCCQKWWPSAALEIL